MQQDGSITFQRVVHTSSIETWHIVVAVFLFAGLICAAVWWSRNYSEKNPGTLNLTREP